MTVDDIINFYGSALVFCKKTGIAAKTYYNWKSKGFIPEMSQMRVEYLSGGALKADLSKTKEKLDDIKKLGEVIRRKPGRPKKQGV
jgi:hypothetical protein